MLNHGDTVRLVAFGTPSQKAELWTVTKLWIDTVEIVRTSDPNCILRLHRNNVKPATILDLMTEL